MLQVKIYRYNPEADSEPYMQDYQIDTGGRDFMVLDILEKLKAEEDNTLVYRRSCREGVCGSDGMNINGQNGLAIIPGYHSLTERPRDSGIVCYGRPEKPGSGSDAPGTGRFLSGSEIKR